MRKLFVRRFFLPLCDRTQGGWPAGRAAQAPLPLHNIVKTAAGRIEATDQAIALLDRSSCVDHREFTGALLQLRALRNLSCAASHPPDGGCCVVHRELPKLLQLLASSNLFTGQLQQTQIFFVLARLATGRKPLVNSCASLPGNFASLIPLPQIHRLPKITSPPTPEN